MLINFKVTNFRSFKEEVEFSMEKGSYLRKFKDAIIEKNNYKLLKSAVIFGANANGKTNLLLAINLLQRIILIPSWGEEYPLPSDTFAGNDEATKFKIEFLKNEKKFTYELSYNKDEIEYEELTENSKIVFKRIGQEYLVIPEKLKYIKDTVIRNQNLLHVAQKNNVEEAKIAYSWFLNNLIATDTEEINTNDFKLLKEDEFKNKFLNFLRAADFNIVDVEVKEIKLSKPETSLLLQKSDIVYELFLKHKSEEGVFELHYSNESTGTRAFIILALQILKNNNSNKVILIDEFDRSFHAELAESLIDLFNHKNQTNQFILTTHKLSLMDNDLRQDQIWFAEKDVHGVTDLFSIYDFDSKELKRKDISYKRRYLDGRFGAIQIINKSQLLDFMENE